jgi:hypothetical protein
MLGASLSLQGQQPPAPAGVASPWGARQILDDLLKDNEKLTPLLNQMRTLDWESKKGAPSAYTTQWHTAQQQLSDVTAASRLLEQKTESLPLALDEYFRLEALEVTTRSLLEGVTRYGERSTADQLSGLIARNFNARERFRDYIRDLATSQEQDFKAADAEAQRCRAMISRQPAAKGTKK